MNQQSDKPTQLNNLIERAEATFLEGGHDEPFKNQVARELNAILNRVHFILSDPRPVEMDLEFARAALAIVDRVADFEEIEMRP